jgi:ABC-type amino acid transport substrate-binding protein
MPRDSKQSTVNSRQSIKGKRFFSSFILHLSSLRVGTFPLVLLGFFLVAYWGFVTFAPKSPAKPDATWTRIVETGALRVGIDPSFPPFESEDGTGHLRGLDIALVDEILREWSKQIEMPIHAEYIYTGYDGLYDALKAGQFDAIVSALPYDPKRTEDVRFSHSYFNGGPFLIVREQDAATKTHFDLQGKRIGVELGSTGDAFARRWEKRLKYDRREFHTPAETLRALNDGHIDAAFVDLIAFYDFTRTNRGVKSIGAPLVDELMVIAVRKDAPTLLAQINAVITAMKADGRLEQLWQTWLVSGG